MNTYLITIHRKENQWWVKLNNQIMHTNTAGDQGEWYAVFFAQGLKKGLQEITGVKAEIKDTRWNYLEAFQSYEDYKG